SGAAEITVTGRGASFSAQNNPARPPPTMTMSLAVESLRWFVMAYLPLSSLRKQGPIRRGLSVGAMGQLSRATSDICGYGSLLPQGRQRQFFRLIIRSIGRRAFSAIAGSTVT